ncbi:hypothetical protein [Escherichia coli]|uniref:hypothetical protein n=1 Tax=Escherichia coli TaxID=562 RepID=UPI002FE6BE2D
MSDPVRITNPGAESLGYDSDGHEIMAVDIYVNLHVSMSFMVPRLHGVPSGTKPSGAETSGLMIPQPEVISKKGTRKSQRTKTRSARSRKRMRISVLKPENASLRRLLQGKKMKTH